MTLGVAELAMFASLLTLSGMRLPQIAPLWALGLTMRHLVLLELARTMLLAVFTFVAAVPVGIGMAWVLLSVVNVEAFGWRLPMHLFPMDWGCAGFLRARRRAAGRAYSAQAADADITGRSSEGVCQ